jgi:hypothetical protein
MTSTPGSLKIDMIFSAFAFKSSGSYIYSYIVLVEK